MISRLLQIAFLIGLMAFPASAQTGVLVMAHGGSPEWNVHVLDSVQEVRKEFPLAVAFGMADPRTLEAGVDSLLAQSVERIVVVRLFLSGESFLESTEYILGKHDRRPTGGMHDHQMRQLKIPVPVLISREGLLDAPEMGRILARRTAALSLEPAQESVLILAHGAGSEEENQSWLARMDSLAHSVRASAPYAHVRVETLREDWEEPRAAAEARIRSFVAEESAAGREVLIVPFRLFGFGPYAQVLTGLDYRADGRGLIPDPLIADWVRSQVARATRPTGEPEQGSWR